MKIKVRCYDEEAETMFYSDQEYDDHFFELNDKGELRCWRIDESDGTLEEPPEPYSTELENDPELCINLPDKNGAVYCDNYKAVATEITALFKHHISLTRDQLQDLEILTAGTSDENFQRLNELFSDALEQRRKDE